MKKAFVLILAALMASSTVACSSTSTPVSSVPTESTASSVEEIQLTVLTAEDVAKKLKESGLPIDNIIVYTEETDTNKLLGRPNQYLSKVNFADITVTQSDDKADPKGGSVETFSNADDLKTRKEYCESISKSVPIFTQYYYVNGNCLLRIDHDVTPTDSKKYEEAFANLK